MHQLILLDQEGINMKDCSKSNEGQSSEKIDEIIDDAIENAEIRRELSDDDLDRVNGGNIIDKIIIFGGYLLR
jgi:hypothetical protein